MYQIYFYVPETDLESVKQAMFSKGAGCIGNYDKCAWQTAGQGQFRSKPGSEPFIGEENKLTTVREYKVEMICSKEHIHEVIVALKSAHPYETPAYTVLQMVEF